MYFDITEVLSNYITQRDGMRQSHAGATQLGMGAPPTTGEILAMIKANAHRLSQTLPPLNLTEWEALCELSGSWLNELRIKGLK